MTFYRGQAVICVRNNWKDAYNGEPTDGPAYLSEWIVRRVYPEDFEGDDYIVLFGDEPMRRVANAFRPKEPDIEALRELLVDLDKGAGRPTRRSLHRKSKRNTCFELKT